MIATFNTAMTETASEILGKHRQKKRRKKKERKKPGSLQKFLIYATKRVNWERKDLSLKNLRNTRKWTTTSRCA